VRTSNAFASDMQDVPEEYEKMSSVPAKKMEILLVNGRTY
jgi:hypothetical protein